MIIGGLLGLVLSVGVVLLLDYLDITAKRAEDLERRIDLPVIGVIPLQRQLTNNVLPVIIQRRPGVTRVDRA
jgi:capsular polysaccharide biosynthesis protein